MARNRDSVPGTWFVTITFQNGTVTRAVNTFTSDGGVVERAEPTLAAAIGVWEPGDKDEEFRFMLYRFIVDLKVTEPSKEAEQAEKKEQEEVEVVTSTFSRILRVRSNNRLVDANTFEGTGTGDFLDGSGTNQIPGSSVFKTNHRGVRLKLVREPE